MDWRPFVFGGFASVSAELCTFPFDLTKTRLQIQGQKVDAKYAEVRYRGMLHAFRTIVREEGPRALYSGFSPAALRQATYGTTKIGIYWTLKRLFFKDVKDERLSVNVLCGVLAGVIGQSLFNPTDVLKVRWQVHAPTGSDAPRMSLSRAFLDVYSKEGVHGLYRGVGPTAARAAVIAGVELPLYDFSKRHLILNLGLADNAVCHGIASVIAGLGGALTATPVDVVKTRMMNQKLLWTQWHKKGSRNIPATPHAAPPTGASSPPGASPAGASSPPGASPAAASPRVYYRSSWHCVTSTVRNEGVLALWRGVVPNFTRLGPWNVVFFVVLEQLNFHFGPPKPEVEAPLM